MGNFFELFNQKTENKYDFLRLSKLIVDKDNATVEITFVLPYEYYRDVFNNKDVEIIKQACTEILPQQFKLQVKFTKCLVDQEIVKKFVYKFFSENHIALIRQIDFNKIHVDIQNKMVKVTLPLVSTIYNFCVKTEIAKKLENFLDSCYSERTKVCFETIGELDIAEVVDKQDGLAITYSTIIHTSNHLKIAGSNIVGFPRQIVTFDKQSDEICICGVVSDYERKVSKKGKLYYTFSLDDTTGVIKCLYASSGIKKGALDCLKNQEVVIAKGSYVEDNFSKGFKLIVKSIAYCRADFDSIRVQKEMLALSQKKRQPIQPIAIEQVKMLNLFDVTDDILPLFKNNNFVVFDLETTGLDPVKDKIIEIGAVKIVDGEIINYYSTLVDPKVPIPPQASNINHIYDEDVKQSPYIEDILDSFLEYCDDCILVAHNATFDISFMRNACRENCKNFDNPYFDTLELSKKAKPMQKNFNLKIMCSVYGIINQTAHRAYSDAQATAELFIKLAKDLNLTEQNSRKN